MTRNRITSALAQMVAGECRWIGHEGIHVYCHGSRNTEGRYHAKKYGTVFKVVCRSRAYDAQPWMDAESAVAIVLEEAAR